MKLRAWDHVPEFMKNDEVRVYYDILSGKKIQLILKRFLDVCLALVLIIILAIPMMIIAILIVLNSKGPVFFRQERVTAYGKRFRIHKFRTMVEDAGNRGTEVTVAGDPRITEIGKKLRNKRLDELPQLFDILEGNMTFVGTRAEVPRYVDKYTPEMLATLLLPAGVTSEASIAFKDEAELLSEKGDTDVLYVEKVLPLKMKINLDSIRDFSIYSDIRTLIRTVISV